MFTRGKPSIVSALAIILAVLCISGGVVGINYALDSGVAWAQQVYWSKTNGELYPSDTESIIIGGDTEATADIFLDAEGNAVFNEQANDVDFRIEGAELLSVTYPYLLYADAGNRYIGIGTNTPQARFQVYEGGSTSLVLPSNTIWLLQNSASAGDGGWLGMVGGSTGDVGFWFGDETSPPDGKITYDNGTDNLELEATDDIVLDCDTVDLDGGQKVKRTDHDTDGNYAVLVTDYYISFTNISADRDADLPAAATAGAGRMYIIANETNGNNVKIDPDGTEHINGSSVSLSVGTDSATMIVCSGTQWFSL
jgi:hypothetical protein